MDNLYIKGDSQLMNSRLIAKNFGPIKDADLDLRRYSIFIGTQASGKSTIAKLIAIFKDIEFVIEPNYNYAKKFSDYNLSNFFSPDTYFKYANGDYTITYEKSNFSITKEEHFISSIANARAKVEKFLDAFIKGQPKSANIPENKEDYLRQLYAANWKNLMDIPVEQIYIPAERMLLSLVSENPFSLFRNFALPTCITNFGLKYEQAKRANPSYPIDFLNITFKTEDGKQKVYYDQTHSLDLSECASGFQAIIPIILVVKSLSKTVTNGSFIIEEPELNLYPSTQKKLIDFIIENLNSSAVKGDLVITTHSPYILSSLNILLLAYITANEHKNSVNEVAKSASENTWINPENFNAFHFSKGKVRQIFNRKINLISENELDEISEDIGGKFEDLMNIYEQSNG